MKKTRPIKAIGRKRSTLGWTLLTLGLLVAGVWVASGWRNAYWGHMRGESLLQTSIAAGVLHVEYVDPVPDLRPTGLLTNPLPKVSWDWKWRYEHISSPKLRIRQTTIQLPLWPIPLLLWTPAAVLLRSGILARRRAMTGSCAKCGYNLAGMLEDAPCPECGKARAIQAKAI